MNDEKTIHIAPPRRIEIAVATALYLLAAFLAVELVSELHLLSNPTTPPANTITVSGTGQTALAPDIAYLTFTVQNSAADVATAQAATTKQANAAISYIEGQGIAAKDVATLSYDISPQYAQTNVAIPVPCNPNVGCSGSAIYQTGTKITGYQVSESIKVTVRDLTKASTLLGGLGSQNVQNVSGPDFGLSDPNAGTDAARAQAIANAKQEAQTEAKQLGVSLGRIVSFSEGGSGPYPIYAMSASTGGKAASAPDLPTGENTYSDTVSITYAIR